MPPKAYQRTPVEALRGLRRLPGFELGLNCVEVHLLFGLTVLSDLVMDGMEHVHLGPCNS